MTPALHRLHEQGLEDEQAATVTRHSATGTAMESVATFVS